MNEKHPTTLEDATSKSSSGEAAKKEVKKIFEAATSRLHAR